MLVKPLVGQAAQALALRVPGAHCRWATWRALHVRRALSAPRRWPGAPDQPAGRPDRTDEAGGQLEEGLVLLYATRSLHQPQHAPPASHRRTTSSASPARPLSARAAAAARSTGRGASEEQSARVPDSSSRRPGRCTDKHLLCIVIQALQDLPRLTKWLFGIRKNKRVPPPFHW